MSRAFLVIALGLTGLLLAMPPGSPRTEAAGYGYGRQNYGGYGYGNYAQNYYQPIYYPVYSYYQPAYSTYSYVQQQSYVDAYDGNYHHHPAGYDSIGRWYPAGFYRWQNKQWYASNGQPYYAATASEERKLKEEVR